MARIENKIAVHFLLWTELLSCVTEVYVTMDTDQQIKEKVDLITSEIKNDLANEMEDRLATMQALLNKSLKEVKNIQDDTKNQGQRATYATGSR